MTTEQAQTGKVNWSLRKEIVFRNKKIYTNKKELIAKAKVKNKEGQMSLAIFKPTKITGFKIEKCESEWDEATIKQLEVMSRQISLFDGPNESVSEFKPVDRLPYNFSYKFEDDAGVNSELQIIDWEIGALYWNCLKGANGDENVAVAKVKEKYYGELLKRDLHFFMGTQLKEHNRSPNPFLIIGVFYPPIDNQVSMFNMV